MNWLLVLALYLTDTATEPVSLIVRYRTEASCTAALAGVQTAYLARGECRMVDLPGEAT